MNKIKLGEEYKDSVTGFVGTATSRTEYLTGCVHIGLQPKVDKDNKIPEAQFFDESRLDSSIKKPGGPGEHPPKGAHH